MNSVDSSVNGAYGESQPEFCVHKRGQVFNQSFLRKSTRQLMLSEGTVALYQESRTGKQKLSYLSFAPHTHAYKCIRIGMSSLCRGRANLLCIAPILVYVLPKRAPSFQFLTFFSEYLQPLANFFAFFFFLREKLFSVCLVFSFGSLFSSFENLLIF